MFDSIERKQMDCYSCRLLMRVKVIFRIVLAWFICQNTIYAQEFQVLFRQYDIETPVIHEHITLAKETFQIQVRFKGTGGVFGACSFNDSLFQIPLDQSLPEPSSIPWKIAVEPAFNADQDMIVSEDSYFYWFYQPKDDAWHRFDPNPIIRRGQVTGTKTISNLFLSADYNASTKSISISEVEKPLYLIFFLINKNGQNFQRIRIKVDWQK